MGSVRILCRVGFHWWKPDYGLVRDGWLVARDWQCAWCHRWLNGVPATSPDPVADRIRLIRDTAGDAGDLTLSDYQRGFYNGLELALAVVEDREPAYVQPCGPATA